MRNRIVLGTLLLLCAVAMVTPASAVTVNGVDYVILAKSAILMENSADCIPLPVNTLGCTIINGNVGVSDTTGTLKIGSNNIINGSATAHSIAFGTASKVTDCLFDVSSGVAAATVCGTIGAPTLPIVAAWPPGPLGAVPVNNCVNLAATPSVTVPAGLTQALAPGCYKDVRLNAGSTLNLSAGAYTFRTLRMLAGSELNGSGATVNVQSLTITEAGVKINDVTIETPGTVGFSVTEFISIGNNSTLSNVILYAPTAGIHLHTGMTATNLEAVANFITVEPIIVQGVPFEKCGCFDSVAKVGTDINLSAGQNLDKANSFVLAVTCNPVGGITVPATSVSPTSATLNAAGVPAGTYHVIALFDSGSYCNNTTVTLP